MMKFLVIFCVLLYSQAIYSKNFFPSQRSTSKFFAPPAKLGLSKDYLKFLKNFADKKCNDVFCDERYETNETFVINRAKRFELRNSAIKQHNKLFEEGKTPFKKRLMRWADWSLPAKLKALCGTRQRPKYRNAPVTSEVNLLKICQGWPKKPPVELNRCQFPNPIRDQQTCGCCWAFASVSVVEAEILQCLSKKTELSVQNLVDCDDNNQACDGGWPTYAFLKIAIDGISDWKSYTYQNDRNWCRKAMHKRVINPHFISKQVEVELNGDEECLMKIIEKVGPVTVAVHADEEFMSYGEGFYANDACPKDEPNHAMVLCGWGTDKVFGDYWLIRNSWGTDWGENGFVRMRRNNTCGVASWAMWPIINGCEYLDVFNTASERKFSYVDSNEDIRRRE